MRALLLLPLLLVPAPQPAGAGAGSGRCDAVGDVRFVCGQSGPEDLVAVPGSEWVVASSYAADRTGLRLINVRDLTTTIVFPSGAVKDRVDRTTYSSCPGPVATDQFRTHGLYLRPGKRSRHTLYAVHHGIRESIEVFDLDARARPPRVTWIGCVVAPEHVSLNSIVGLPDGGLAATNFQRPGGSIDEVRAGKMTGEVWEWHPGVGWTPVPRSEASGPNGIEISRDGKWFYISGWGSLSIIRLSRGRTPVRRDEVPAGFRVDNLRWAPDGSILAAGQGETGNVMTASIVASLDPKTLKIREILRHPSDETFGIGTTALQIGKELWVGSVRGDRIARFPVRQP